MKNNTPHPSNNFTPIKHVNHVIMSIDRNAITAYTINTLDLNY